MLDCIKMSVTHKNVKLLSFWNKYLSTRSLKAWLLSQKCGNLTAEHHRYHQLEIISHLAEIYSHFSTTCLFRIWDNYCNKQTEQLSIYMQRWHLGQSIMGKPHCAKSEKLDGYQSIMQDDGRWKVEIMAIWRKIEPNEKNATFWLL